jgi:hypothetical protein
VQGDPSSRQRDGHLRQPSSQAAPGLNPSVANGGHGQAPETPADSGG